MSRIGKTPIYLPEGVTITVTGSSVALKGPKGELARTFPESVRVQQETDEAGKAFLAVSIDEAQGGTPALWGTARAHVANIVHGVKEGWAKSLELNGVGFKMNVSGQTLKMSLGFSHEVIYNLPQGITGTIEGNVLTVSGVDRELVGKVASEIRAFKKPEPYKGKGFRYTDEIIRRKVGKAAKSE